MHNKKNNENQKSNKFDNIHEFYSKIFIISIVLTFTHICLYIMSYKENIYFKLQQDNKNLVSVINCLKTLKQ